MLQKEQLERAHAAAEVIAAKHEAAAWQARLQQQMQAQDGDHHNVTDVLGLSRRQELGDHVMGLRYRKDWRC